MELSIICRETVKPSSLPLDHLKPYKVCLFDQITPITYPTMIIFYRSPDQNFNDNFPQSLAVRAGRTKDNFYVDDFDAGVTYIEARVNCSLTEFFELRQTELLDKFVPFPPLRNEKEYSGETEVLPQMGFQVNIFACGGIALGTSFCHKIADAGSVCHFLMSWATTFRGSPENIVRPNLTSASVVFPPRDSLPPKYQTLTDRFWFQHRNPVTRGFVFDENSISALRELAKSEGVPEPSPNDVLTCFIWKCMSATLATATGGARRASVMAQVVKIRPRMKSKALKSSIGNLFWYSLAASSHVDMVELCELVRTLRESLLSFNEFLDGAHQGKLTFITNWERFFNEVDFGWGKPIWVGAHGKAGRLMNATVLVEAQGGKVIEAFVTLEESHMAALEKDPKFLAFASLNPEGVPPIYSML
ncbi:Transferase [Trema orientale]|uniref:Transferase n=1 Tax=Trema orientale TaxID=63057 RepID=A0A2P5EFR8_TREOI|nr:Transferase [Trema orientale]